MHMNKIPDLYFFIFLPTNVIYCTPPSRHIGPPAAISNRASAGAQEDVSLLENRKRLCSSKRGQSAVLKDYALPHPPRAHGEVPRCCIINSSSCRSSCSSSCRST